MSLPIYRSYIKLDVSCELPVEVVKAKQLDNNSRLINIIFVDEDGTSITLDPNATAEFRIRRPDGVLIIDTDNTSIYTSDSPNQVWVTLTDAMLEVPGRALADLRLINDEHSALGDTVLSGGSFFIDIYETPTGRDFTGYSGTDALSNILTRAQYEATTHSESTVYLVKEPDGAVNQYLGSTPISSSESGGLSFMKLTQEQYDAIVTPDPNTVYIIVG